MNPRPLSVLVSDLEKVYHISHIRPIKLFIGVDTNINIRLQVYNFIGMETNNQTTIMVSKDTWKKLNGLKECGDSMSDVVIKILTKVTK